ncbi:MAG: hypothetical protein ABW120_15845 [Sedimenticola sp.]
MKFFDIDNLPQHGYLSFYIPEDPGDNEQPVRAARINGPFTIKTENDDLACENGYLVIDLDGSPYPVDQSLFKKLYRRLGSC